MPFIWQLSATQFKHQTLIHGVLVKDMPPHHDGGNFSNNNNLIKLAKSYFIKPYANVGIDVECNGLILPAQTDSHGAFLIYTDSLKTDQVLIYEKNTKTPLTSVVKYPQTFKAQEGPFEVISDIDDTIMMSYSPRTFKRIKTIAFNHPEERAFIPYTHQLLQSLHDKDNRIFYVSKSESNLFGMICHFLSFNNFPKGDIFLTPYLKLSQLLNSKKGKTYKEEMIDTITTGSEKPIILIGDDGQKDMKVYTTVALKYPERIRKVFIRQTRNTVSSSQLMDLQKLKATGIPVTYFNKDDIFKEKTLIT